MSEKLMKAVWDGNTGETIEVEMSPEEVTKHLEEVAVFEAAEVERTAAAEALAALKVSAKAKLVAGQPLTAEEADTLVL